MVGNHIGLVLAGARHLEVLTHEAGDFLSEVELGRLLEAIVVLVAARSWHLDALHHVLALRVTNGSGVRVEVVALLQRGVEGRVGGRTDLRLVLVLVNLGVRLHDLEAGNGLATNLVVGLRARRVVHLLMNGGLAQDGLGLVLLVGHLSGLDMVRCGAWRVSEVSLLLNLAGVRCPWDAEGVAGLGKLNGSVLGGRRVVLWQVLGAAGSRSKGGSLNSVERLLALLVLLGHLVSAWTGTVDLLGPQMVLVTYTVAKARAELEARRRWRVLHLIVAWAQRLQVLVLVGLSGGGQRLLVGDLVRKRDGAPISQLHHLVRLRVLLVLDEAADIKLLRLAGLRVSVIGLAWARNSQISRGSSLACAEAIKKLLIGSQLTRTWEHGWSSHPKRYRVHRGQGSRGSSC